MKPDTKQTIGQQTISEDLEFHGQIVGNTTVNSGVIFTLHGQIVGDLLLMENSNVILHGMVNGNVINQGGNLDVFGMICGNLSKNGGTTTIHPKALVTGHIH